MPGGGGHGPLPPRLAGAVPPGEGGPGDQGLLLLYRGAEEGGAARTGEHLHHQHHRHCTVTQVTAVRKHTVTVCRAGVLRVEGRRKGAAYPLACGGGTHHPHTFLRV